MYFMSVNFILKAVTLVTLYRLAVLFGVNAGESIIFQRNITFVVSSRLCLYKNISCI